MTTQNKCFICSLLIHASIIGVIFAGSVFALNPFTEQKNRNKPERQANLPIIQQIPQTIVDELLYNPGGNPEPQPAPQIQTPAPPKKETANPIIKKNTQTPKPKVSQPKPKKQTPKPNTASTPSSKPKEKTVTPTKTKPRQLKEISLEDLEAKQAAEQAEKEALAQRNALLEAISGAKNSISDQNDEYSSSNHSIASSTSIRSASLGNGDGSGSGLAVANYGQIIRSRYNNAWVSPSSLKNPNLQTTAKIVILRNGTIQSSRITKYSGDASLDESVQKVLDTIIKVPPFPKSSKDTTRTYTIHFSLRGIDTD